MTGRVPPHNLEAEEALLGAMLLNPAAIDEASGVAAGDFYKQPAHGHVFDVIRALHAASEPVDAVTVAERLRAAGQLAAVGGPGILVSLQAGTPATSNARKYAAIVREKARRRKMIELAVDLGDCGYGEDDPTPLVDRLASIMREPRAGDDEIAGRIDWAEFWHDPDDGGGDWLAEPILPAGRQVAMYATAKAGKSLLLLEIAAALATGRPVLDRAAAEPIRVTYLDYEMTADDLRDRLSDLGYGSDDDLSNLAYLLLPSLPPLDTAAGGAELLQHVQAHGSRLVVVDTVARAVEGEENSADTIRAFYRHTGRFLKAERVALARADHAGKKLEKGSRGTSAKAEDVDIVWRLTTEGRNVHLTRTHTRVPWVPERVLLTRFEEPYLRHAVKSDGWPDGTGAVAASLDRLKLPLDIGVNDAMDALRSVGEGKRKQVVGAALRYRRQTPEKAA